MKVVFHFFIYLLLNGAQTKPAAHHHVHFEPEVREICKYPENAHEIFKQY